MLELDDLIDISNPSRPHESEQNMARCPKTKGPGMKLTVMMEELGMLGLSENRKEASVGPDQFRSIRYRLIHITNSQMHVTRNFLGQGLRPVPDLKVSST